MKKTLFCCFAALTLVSCQQEQSELNFADIAGSATIKGRVVYNGGQEVIDRGQNYVVLTDLPAVNVEVVAQIPYSEYDSESLQSGVKQIIVKTDANGYYQITLPVTNKALSSVTIKARGFEGVYCEATYDSDKGKYISTETKAFYGEGSTVEHNIYDGDVRVVGDIVLPLKYKYEED